MNRALFGFARPAAPTGPVYTKRTLVDGRPTDVRCLDLCGQVHTLTGKLVTTVRLEDEWYVDADAPQQVIDALLEAPAAIRPDLYTFWQRPPDIEARFDHHTEWESIAALPIVSYEQWWSHRITSKVRSQIRKSQKSGVVVREVPFDDDFVRGMTAIFNEAPLRQGRPFWHYNKNFDTVKAQFSRFVHRETMIGAYLEEEMIGFIMLGNAGRFGLTGQIISSIRHRDKQPNYALIAKAVQVCESLGLGHLVYLHWGDDGLAEFKRRCGFEPVRVPRYVVPLTRKGRLALACGLHRSLKTLLPRKLKSTLKQWRNYWYESRAT